MREELGWAVLLSYMREIWLILPDETCLPGFPTPGPSRKREGSETSAQRAPSRSGVGAKACALATSVVILATRPGGKTNAARIRSHLHGDDGALSGG